MAAVLDPRDARPLTSREIAKVLMGMLGGVVAHEPECHAELGRAIESAKPGGVVELRRKDWVIAFRATVAGLRGWCDERDVSTALAWLSDNVPRLFPAPGSVPPVPKTN